MPSISKDSCKVPASLNSTFPPAASITTSSPESIVTSAEVLPLPIVTAASPAAISSAAKLEIDAEAQLKVPLPFVVKCCPLDPSAVGKT